MARRKFVFPETIIVYPSDGSLFGLDNLDDDDEDERTDEERAMDSSDEDMIAKYKLVSVGKNVSPKVDWSREE
jgi:hypothetical protein